MPIEELSISQQEPTQRGHLLMSISDPNPEPTHENDMPFPDPLEIPRADGSNYPMSFDLLTDRAEALNCPGELVFIDDEDPEVAITDALEDWLDPQDMDDLSPLLRTIDMENENN